MPLIVSARRLLRAEEALAQARRALVSLDDEARRLAEIRAPVEGQVLTVRVHVVHGSEGTAQIRLLYRRPSPLGDRGRLRKRTGRAGKRI